MSVRSALLIVLALVAASCDSAPSASVGPTAIVVADGAVPDERSIVAPGSLAAQLALREAGIRPIPVDIAGDPAAPGLAEMAADPAVVGVIVAPFTRLDDGVWSSLVASGTPVLSLSQLTPDGAATRSFASSPAATTEMIARAVPSDACVVSGGDPWGAAYAQALLAAGPTTWRPTSSPAGCDGAVWSGDAAAAPTGPGVLLSDQARTMSLLRSTGPSDGGLLGICACVDPGSSAAPALQAFVHAYQEATGLDPGPYAAEAFDAAQLLVQTWRTGGDRDDLLAALAGRAAYRGVAGTYRWDDAGALIEPAPQRYRALGYRWTPA